jgi:hypothetical protein
VDLAGDAGGDRFEAELRTHTAAWAAFWDAAAIRLEDAALEALWYRGLYGFACHLRPGAQAPGLNANIPITDRSAHGGKYTWNHNVQKWYFPALPANHPEWYDVLADLIAEQTPTFRHLARTLFGLDGVYCDLSGRPRPVAHRATTHPVVGRALCHTGWLAAMLYQHFEFTGDAAWLRDRAYPYLREAARFYAGYLDKYQGEDLVIYPSMRLEDGWTDRGHGAWGEDFLGNRNVATDLVMIRKAFEAAIAAAEILEVDAEARARWARCLARVPEIDYGWRDGKGWYAICEDWERAGPISRPTATTCAIRAGAARRGPSSPASTWTATRRAGWQPPSATSSPTWTCSTCGPGPPCWAPFTARPRSCPSSGSGLWRSSTISAP